MGNCVYTNPRPLRILTRSWTIRAVGRALELSVSVVIATPHSRPFLDRHAHHSVPAQPLSAPRSAHAPPFFLTVAQHSAHTTFKIKSTPFTLLQAPVPFIFDFLLFVGKLETLEW